MQVYGRWRQRSDIMGSKYYQLLNNYDRKFMNDSIHETIFSFDNYITAFIPLPEDKQRNFDKYMREYNGAILFYKKIVLAERIELVQDYNDTTKADDIDYGRRDSGKLAYAIPDDIPIIDDHGCINGYEHYRPSQFDIFQVDESDDRYYVETVKDRIGQYVVIMHKYDGTTPNGINLKDILVLEDDDELVMEIKDPLYKRMKDEYDDMSFSVSTVDGGTSDSEDINMDISDDSSIALHDIDSFTVSGKDNTG